MLPVSALSSIDPELELLDDIAAFDHDPLGFVEFAFEWGTGELAGHDGPMEWQRQILADMRDGLSPTEALRIAVASGHGIGKALAHGEPVLTPRGWRPIESLRAGDFVSAGDGSPTEIVGVFPQGERECYRVTLDDGCSVVVDGDHQWFTTTRSERKHDKPGQVRTTRQIADSLTFPNGPRHALNHQIPTCGQVYHPTAMLPIDPYVLGCWLGDGDAVGRITCERSLVGMMIGTAGAVVGKEDWKGGNNKASAYSILGIRPALRLLGLYGKRAHEKSIPRVYRYASISQRIALLQGLLDTDGSVNSNAVTFEVTAPQLASDTAELVRSLGGVVRRSEKLGAYGGKTCRRVYRLYISLPTDVAPFRLPVKANRYQPQSDHRNCWRTKQRFIASVERVGLRAATCIAVDHPLHLYITRDHIVTHNSALVSWIILWAMSTCVDTIGVVTANTGDQLRLKTWVQLSKWHRLCITSHWFAVTAKAIFSVDPDHEKTWRIDAVTWNETRTEAFAGLHNEGKRILLLFDEAGGIPDVIFDVSTGALTDSNTEIIWSVFGNPTRNIGRFRECFAGGKFSHRWNTRQIDSRSVPITNKEEIAEWVADYGEDSDFIRVRVKGTFPRAGSMQFISGDLVKAASAEDRDVNVTIYDPLVMGVDVARFGDDKSVIRFRRGRDARTIPPLKFRNIDTMQLAAKISELQGRYHCDAIFIDGGGPGAGVVDRCRYLKLPVTEIQFGSTPDRDQIGQEGAIAYANKRAEIWGTMKEWLRGGMIDDDAELKADLTALEYGYMMKDGRDAIVLEKKEHMKKRGLSSPDDGDALALTFAYAIGQSDHSQAFARGGSNHVFEYDPCNT